MRRAILLVYNRLNILFEKANFMSFGGLILENSIYIRYSSIKPSSNKIGFYRQAIV